MRYLIVSDIHANLEALQSVLAEAEGRYDHIVCCGDFVDYGASPNEVIDWAREKCFAYIRGNHDKASSGLDDTDDYNPLAQAAVRWTMRALTPANLGWLARLAPGPLTVEPGMQLVHGSPNDEDEYLLEAYEILLARTAMQAPLVFFGHTHVQIGFHFHGDQGIVIPQVPPQSSSSVIEMEPDDWYLINPGSVGQPRDRDWRAAYALYDSEAKRIEMRRVAYDVHTAQKRIRDAGLPPMLAERLSRGQ